MREEAMNRPREKKIDIPVKNVQRQPAARTFARMHASVRVYVLSAENVA